MNREDAEALRNYANPMRGRLGLADLSIEDAKLIIEMIEGFQANQEADRARRRKKSR